MSRYTRLRDACSHPILTAILAVVTALVLLAPGPAPAGVIVVSGDTYRLDDGKPVTGAWEIAEKLAYDKDAAIVVTEPQSAPAAVQTMLQLLQTLKVPTVLTRKADFEILLKRGVLRPHANP